MERNYRYMDCQAIEVEGKLVPLWEFKYKINELENACFYFKEKPYEIFQTVIDALWDCKKSICIYRKIINIDRNYDEEQYKVGEAVGHELYKNGKRGVIVKTITALDRGRHEDKIEFPKEVKLYFFHKGYTTDVPFEELDPKTKYTFRIWDKKYEFSDGTVCEWEHELFKIFSD